MTSEPTTDSELAALRARLAQLEDELAERTAQANAASAAAQDKSYWLDRWHLDLNALMRRRGASELRAGVRGVRAVYRAARGTRERVLDLAARRGAARARLAADRSPTHDPEPALAPPPASEPLRGTPVTDRLFERLDPSAPAQVEARLTGSDAALWSIADADDQRRLTLSLGLYYGVPQVLERSGLSPAMPPAEVHAMARGASATGGSTYHADLVASALERSGGGLEPGAAALDFGCSSGRLVRVLAAAHPELEWHGCDPIAEAIGWAREQLPGIDFRHSPEAPPLPYDADRFDVVVALSIWSHFSAAAALAWLAEMARVVRPGGRLVLTTHGHRTIAHDGERGLRAPAQLEDAERGLREGGFWFANEFGATGDHGVANADWGTAFMAPEWLLARATPAWRVALFAPGQVEHNQDLYVLVRP